jgi:hypothetical protein
MPNIAVKVSYLTLRAIADQLFALPTEDLVKSLHNEAERGKLLGRRTEAAFSRIAEIAQDLRKDGSWATYKALPEALADLEVKVAIIASVDDDGLGPQVPLRSVDLPLQNQSANIIACSNRARRGSPETS